MIRAIVCPPDVPENYSEIIVIFAEHDSRRGKSGTMMHFGASLLEALRHMSVADRMRSIKLLCSELQDSLLQSSSTPDDFKVREITGKCN
jgi:hypothetical protein